MTESHPPSSSTPALLAALVAVNRQAAFNRWTGFEVRSASPGAVEMHMPWREEVGQYSGFLHAGVIGALIDTACGFAASTLSGPVLASQYSVRCLAPAVGQAFMVKGRVVKAGKRQVFAAADLFCQPEDGAQWKLVAVGDAVMVPVG
jgi:uncharacterized protein (TIGR00369 family)